MGKTRRCRSVFIGASVAALGAVGACPAAGEPASASQAPRATIARKHSDSRHQHAPRAVARRGPYVYKATLGGEVSYQHPNAVCSGATVTIRGVTLYGEGANSGALWQRNPESWNGRFTITTAPASTIAVSWGSSGQPEDQATVAAICAATSPGATVASIGMAAVTWHLAAPVSSVAALVKQPAACIEPNEDVLAFEILPNGTVPPFSPGLEHP